MEWIKYVSGPIVGAIIGYFTNYLAVKMLFRPYYPKYIGKIKIPFTPGVIPKRQKDLAKAIGNAIENNLFTKDDLKNTFTSQETEDKIIGSLMMKMYSNESLNDELLILLDGDKSLESKNKISHFIAKRLNTSLINANIKEKIIDFGMKFYLEKKESLGMLQMFIKDEMIQNILFDISKEVENKIKEKGEEIIFPYVYKEIETIFNEPINDLTVDFDKNVVYSIMKKCYSIILDKVLSKFLDEIKIGMVVEEKINKMDVKELEKLCLSVMKKELNAVVNIGALIGLIIGIVNIFI